MSEPEYSQPKNLKERMRNLINDKTHADVEFIVSGSSTEIPLSIHAHKAVLCVNSPVFSAMFSGPLKEERNVIEVTDITPVAFRKMIRFMYTDEYILETNEEIFETYQAADKYMVSELKDKCRLHIDHLKVKPAAACMLLENAIKFNMTDLESRIHEVIQKRTGEVFPSSGFLKSKLETVMKILELDTLDVVSEIDVFQAVIAWGEKEKSRTGGTLRQIIDPLLPNICLNSINPISFCDFLSRNPDIFTESEAFCILSSLTKPGVVDVPEYLNISKTRKTTRNFQATMTFRPELIRLKLKRHVWFNESTEELIACVFITNVQSLVLIHSVQVEWKVLSQLPIEVRIDHIATSDYSLISRQEFEAPTQFRTIVRKTCFLHLLFSNCIEIKPSSSLWIYVKVTFDSKVTIKYQDHVGDKHDNFDCIISNTKFCLPLVSELCFSTKN